MADDRVALIAKRYATCRAYVDRGTVFVNRQLRGRFNTRFVRDGEVLDFVYDDVDGAHYELSSRGGHCSMQLPPALAALTFDYPLDTPDLCIAALTGISFGAALSGPRLLMPDRVDGASVVAAAPMAPMLIGEDAWSLVFAVPAYGTAPFVAVFDARTLLLRAVGDGKNAAQDWTQFDYVALYDHVVIE